MADDRKSEKLEEARQRAEKARRLAREREKLNAEVQERLSAV